MVFTLKPYQQRCLSELRVYLHRASQVGAKMAFLEQTERPYRSVEQLPGLPYVCIRVPTGGGKTVLAAHAIGLVAGELLHAERCAVLWLAPTNAIVQQTFKALRDPRHPYRLALHEAFGGRVSILDLSEALYLRRGTLDSDTVVIVSTLAALRVTDTEGRKVYESNGALQQHFTGLTESQLAMLERSGEGSGVLAYSLANVLRLRRPVVIIDEAHNARTPLSFETLARFSPSCIVEFTATPDQETNPSNVLTQVSAAELKADEMIKLPIYLATRRAWKEAVQATIAKQRELERIAREEEKETGEYLRPIVLFQAQSKSKLTETVTVDVLRECLLTDFNIPEAEIAIATGDRWQLDGLDLFSSDCPVRFVLTVQALREGWDCPFAYVLCSVSNLSSRTAVEQILGRVLRMPQARRKQQDALNHAYAFATSEQFPQTAQNLTDALVESGFERFEAKSLVDRAPELPFGPALPVQVEERLTAPPQLETLPPDLKSRLRYDETGGTLHYDGPPLTGTEAETLQRCCEAPADKQAVRKLAARTQGKVLCPASSGEPFSVPALVVRSGTQKELFEEQFRDAPWSLSESDPLLDESEYRPEALSGAQLAEVDVTKQGNIEYHFVAEVQNQLSLFDYRGPETGSELAVWLDRQIRHPDITHVEASVFLRRMIEALIDKRGIPLEKLVASRFRLRDAAAEKISQHRRKALEQSFQHMLFPQAESKVETDASVCFHFPPDQYPAQRFYEGPIRFTRHYYERPAAMNGEEAACASIIDNLPVRYWVRNLERDTYAFWLQTTTDKFYPDFVALLIDGRVLTVEYKGGHLLETPDSIEKRMIGELWEARSNGRCLFRMVGQKDMMAKLSAVAGS